MVVIVLGGRGVEHTGGCGGAGARVVPQGLCVGAQEWAVKSGEMMVQREGWNAGLHKSGTDARCAAGLVLQSFSRNQHIP